MVGVMEFHRVGPAFLNATECMEVLLELWEIRRGEFGNEEKVILYVFHISYMLEVKEYIDLSIIDSIRNLHLREKGSHI